MLGRSRIKIIATACASEFLALFLFFVVVFQAMFDNIKVLLYAAIEFHLVIYITESVDSVCRDGTDIHISHVFRSPHRLPLVRSLVGDLLIFTTQCS